MFMMEGEGVQEEDMGRGTEGLGMIILVDMTVTMGVDLVILMRDLMVDTWAVQVLAIKIGILVVVLSPTLSVLVEPRGKE